MDLIHLYRRLLRESSYLPPAFSDIITQQIRHQFHQHKKVNKHVKKRTMRARAALSTMRAANHGDANCMGSLIEKGFGRTGKRRRELLAQFVAPQGPSDSASLEALLSEGGPKAELAAGDETQAEGDSNQPTGSRPTHPFIDKWDRTKLSQFLKSQREVQGTSSNSLHWIRGKLRQVKEGNSVPKVNSWGKPPSETLTRAKLAGFWRRQADKMVPPVEKGEWELLERLTLGAQNEGEWSIPPRRTKAKLLLGDEPEATWDWKRYATNPTYWIERPRTSRVRSNPEDTAVGPYRGRKTRDSLPERWFRRAYQKVWQMTSYMEQDPNKLEYQFKWGTAKINLTPPNKGQLSVFKGVDANGRLPRTKEEILEEARRKSGKRKQESNKPKASQP